MTRKFVEQFSRVVIDQTGNIVMVCHLDNEGQYKDPAFTKPNCVTADMRRTEYEAAATSSDEHLLKVRALLQVSASKLDAKAHADFITAIDQQLVATDMAIIDQSLDT